MLQKLENKIREMNRKEDALLLAKHQEFDRLSKHPELRKESAKAKARLGKEVSKATLVSLGVTFALTKILKIPPFISTLLVPTIATAIVKSKFFEEKKPLLIDKL